jgi:hypothetical protein
MVATGVVAALSVAVITFAATTISTSISTGGTLSVTGLSSLGNASTTILSTTGNLMVNGFATTTAANGSIATQGSLTVKSGIYSLNYLFFQDMGGDTSQRIVGLKSEASEFKIVTFNSDYTNDLNAIVMNERTNNVGIGNPTEIWSKLQVTGGGTGTGQLFSLVDSASTTVLQVLDNGKVGIGTTSPSTELAVSSAATTTLNLHSSSATKGGCIQLEGPDGTVFRAYATTSGPLYMEIGSCK